MYTTKYIVLSTFINLESRCSSAPEKLIYMPVQVTFFFNLLLLVFFSDEFAVNSQATMCSVECGWGKRIYAKVNCNNKNNQGEAKCDQSLETTEEKCKIKDCPKNNYGQWSSWTPCSITCKSNVNERSVSIILSAFILIHLYHLEISNFQCSQLNLQLIQMNQFFID